MKKHENIITTIGAVALLLGVMLTPSINAMMLEGKTVETATKTTIIKENNSNKDLESINHEPLCIGVIYGKTGYLFGWGVFGLPFTLVEVRLGNTVVRRGISGFFCNYRMLGLPLGRTYTVTASSDAILQYGDKYYRFINQTQDIILTAEKICAELDFFLQVEPIDHPGNGNSNIYQILEPTQEYYGSSQNNQGQQSTLSPQSQPGSQSNPQVNPSPNQQQIGQQGNQLLQNLILHQMTIR